MTRAILFKNWTNEDFTHTWDGVEYTFKAGQAMLIDEGLALHFAKHLANREINRKNKPINDPQFKEFFDNCLDTNESVEAKDEKSLETKLNNIEEVADNEAEEEEKPAKKGKPAKKTDEEEFEGLK